MLIELLENVLLLLAPSLLAAPLVLRFPSFVQTIVERAADPALMWLAERIQQRERRNSNMIKATGVSILFAY